MNLAKRKSVCHLLTEGGKTRGGSREGGKHNYKLTILLKMPCRKAAEEIGRTDLKLSNTANGVCLGRVLVYQVERGIADDKVELVLVDLVKERYGVVVL